LVVTDGLAITLEPVVVFRPAPGDHVKVFAPLAVSVVEPPLHITPLFTVTVGNGFTDTVVTEDVCEHPFPFVTVTE
jgi:hypothetical protein